MLAPPRSAYSFPGGGGGGRSKRGDSRVAEGGKEARSLLVLLSAQPLPPPLAFSLPFPSAPSVPTVTPLRASSSAGGGTRLPTSVAERKYRQGFNLPFFVPVCTCVDPAAPPWYVLHYYATYLRFHNPFRNSTTSVDPLPHRSPYTAPSPHRTLYTVTHSSTPSPIHSLAYMYPCYLPDHCARLSTIHTARSSIYHYRGFAGLCVHKSVGFSHICKFRKYMRGFAGLSMHKVLAEH
jgi:hypothetical protein